MAPKHLPQSDFSDRQKLPPSATPKVEGKKIRWFKNPSNRLKMIPKHLPQRDSDARQKLPPSAIAKVGGEKIPMFQESIKSIENDPKTPSRKPF